MKQASNTLLLFVLLFLPSCGRVASPDAREQELIYLRCVMPENLLEFAHVEVPAIENIAIQGEGADQYLGLHLFAGQKKLNKGIRAEISTDYPHQPGDTVRYTWRCMVPKGFQSDAPKNRWWIIGQWHSLAVEIRWSRNADGHAELYLDDMNQPAVEFDGPNMHNDFQHFLKLGMYRHPEIATDNWIYLDDLTITTQSSL